MKMKIALLSTLAWLPVAGVATAEPEWGSATFSDGRKVTVTETCDRDNTTVQVGTIHGKLHVRYADGRIDSARQLKTCWKGRGPEETTFSTDDDAVLPAVGSPVHLGADTPVTGAGEGTGPDGDYVGLGWHEGKLVVLPPKARPNWQYELRPLPSQ